jgi:hypothetical protein
MKRTSWEIIVAGILLLFVAITITSKKEEKGQPHEQEVAQAQADKAEETARAAASEKVRVINIESLAGSDDLKELSKLRSLEGLEKLKGLANLIPDSAKREMLSELNLALSELQNDSFSINIDLDENLVLLQKEYKEVQGDWTDISPGVYAYTQEFDASNLEDISIQLTGGSVILIGSDNVKSSITVKASGEIAALESLKETVSVSLLDKNSNAEIRVVNSKKESSNIQLQTTIVLPSNLGIISFTDGGHIEATNFKGDVEFKTSGGHIKLKELSGDITAFTEGGHINMSNSEGDASLKSLGGHLTAENFKGPIEMRTSGGNVLGNNLAGSVNAFSSGGNIQLQFQSIDGEIQARNGAGQIDISLPSNTNADLNLNGTKVDIDSRFNFKGDKKKGQIIGKIGNGGVLITAKTGYGTVLIERNE